MVSRRELLMRGGAAVFAASPLIKAGAALSATDARAAARIDVHHHIIPPEFIAEERERILKSAPGFASQILNWTPARALESMDRNGVAAAIVSVALPGAPADLQKMIRLCRACNEYAAKLISEHPGRFGAFAQLPVSDVDASLKEIEYALGTLRLNGVGLLTSYGDVYPGDARYAPIFDELNRRGAVVFVHPTVAQCCANVVAEVPPAFIEFPFDSTRAIASLLYSGTFSRCDKIKFIFSHGGGTLPMLADRLSQLARYRKDLQSRVPQGAMHELRKLYFDIASVTNEPGWSALTALAEPSHILFGTDYPLIDIEDTVHGLEGLHLPQRQRVAVERDNARALFPV
jgi:predicted TIM-barrel fold metal-dependent hydrolase